MSEERDDLKMRWEAKHPVEGSEYFWCAVTVEEHPRTLFYSYDPWGQAAIEHAVKVHNRSLEATCVAPTETDARCSCGHTFWSHTGGLGCNECGCSCYAPTLGVAKGIPARSPDIGWTAVLPPSRLEALVERIAVASEQVAVRQCQYMDAMEERSRPNLPDWPPDGDADIAQAMYQTDVDNYFRPLSPDAPPVSPGVFTQWGKVQ